jgi:hypothetical protein
MKPMKPTPRPTNIQSAPYLPCLGLPGELADDEDHVGDQASDADCEEMSSNSAMVSPNMNGALGSMPGYQSRLAFALAAIRMRSAFRRMKPWASFWL